MKIWILTSIANNYDQPDNNLEAWWVDKPSFEVLLEAIGGDLKNTKSILSCAKIYEGEEVLFNDASYHLRQVDEGRIAGKSYN